jgi:hypothetical protein
MVKFEFKMGAWTNEDAPYHNRLVALVAVDTAVGTDPADSNMDDTVHPGRPAAVLATRASTATAGGDTDRTPIGRGCQAGSIATRWNQPKL